MNDLDKINKQTIQAGNKCIQYCVIIFPEFIYEYYIIVFLPRGKKYFTDHDVNI